MGTAIRFAKTRDSYLEFDPCSGHTVLSGATRSGKSVGSYTMLALTARLPRVQIVGIDPSSILLHPHSIERPTDFALGTSPESLDKAVDLLRTLEKIMDDRTVRLLTLGKDKLSVSDMSDESPAILLVLEEYAGFLSSFGNSKEGKANREECIRIIGRILREGAKVLIHAFTIIQRPEANILHDRAQYARRISYRLDNADSVKMLFDVETETVGLITNLTPGELFYHRAGDPMIFARSPFIDYPTYRSLVMDSAHLHPYELGKELEQ